MTKRLDIFELFADDEVVPEIITTATAEGVTMGRAETIVHRHTGSDWDGAR